MNNKRYIIAGNRAFVFQKMRELGLNICKVWAVKDSYFEKYLNAEEIDFSIIDKKENFLKEIEAADFDVFVSNGLPVILPEEVFCNGGKIFLNIHPSLLPDLRGRDPIPAAILYRRDAGATCHIMNREIDGGDIISQIKIPYSDDLDAGLLYQLSFKAEADVFEEAYKKNFIPVKKQILHDTDIYYSYVPKDMNIDLSNDTAEVIASKVKAFSTGNKGARLHINNKIFICSDIKCLNNTYAKEQYSEADFKTILLRYEDRIVVKNVYNELLDLTIKSEYEYE